jgi:hypothetical protein
LLEAIRLTVINNLLEFHPVTTSHPNILSFYFSYILHNFLTHTLLLDDLDQESSSQLAMGAAFGVLPPTEPVKTLNCDALFITLSTSFVLH